MQSAYDWTTTSLLVGLPMTEEDELTNQSFSSENEELSLLRILHDCGSWGMG